MKNSFQEAILDWLVGTRFIWNERDRGPLSAAEEVVKKFGLKKAKEEGTRLGYPPLFQEAITGASEVFFDLESQKDFAINFFSEVPPPLNPPTLSRKQIYLAAAWSAERAYQVDGKAVQLESHLNHFLIPTELEILLARPNLDREIGFALNQFSQKLWAIPTISQPFQTEREIYITFYLGLRTLLEYANDDDFVPCALLTCRHAGRTIGLKGGIAEAIRYCTDLAAEIGI